ncbi:uncharacterized protein LOC144148703 isoform X2 [Haemaphysalis longicornis]
MASQIQDDDSVHEEDDDLGIVHSKWMKGKACFWPPDSRSAEQLAKSASSPTSDWQLVPCTQLQSFSTYEQARKKLRRAEDTSDLESEMDLGRGKRKKKQRRDCSSSPEVTVRAPPAPCSMLRKASGSCQSATEYRNNQRASGPSTALCADAYDSETDCVSVHSQASTFSQQLRTAGRRPFHSTLHCHTRDSSLPTIDGDTSVEFRDVHVRVADKRDRYGTKAYQTQSSSKQSSSAHLLTSRGDGIRNNLYLEASEHNGGANRDARSAHRQIGCPEQDCQQFTQATVAPHLSKQLLRLLQTILLRIEHQGTQLDAIVAKLSCGALEAREDLLEGPISDIEEFEKFNQDLSQSINMKAKVMQELSGVGGSNTSTATRRILEALLTQEVAVQYSWLGQKGKKKFASLPVCQLIYKAVKRMISSENNKSIEDIIKTWLRHAGEKLHKRRTNSNSQAVDEPVTDDDMA